MAMTYRLHSTQFLQHMRSFGKSAFKNPQILGKLFSVSAWRRLLTSDGRHSQEARIEAKTRKMQLRREVFHSGRWVHEGEFSRRRYLSYEDYLTHQGEKLAIAKVGLENREEEALGRFVKRFQTCPELAERHNVLCLGARLGTEVKALLQLGHLAVGIDLKPGPDNQFVMTGDFHNLVFPDNSLDCVYTNSLDHAFDLERIAGEVSRVLRPNGIFLVDVLAGYEEGFFAGDFEAMHWPDANALIDELSSITGMEILGTRNLGDLGEPNWTQAVLRKKSS